MNLELAKRLKELGVKQESLFHWQPSYYDRKTMVVVAEGAEDWSDDVESYSAFTVAELGEMLPSHVQINGNAVPISTRRHGASHRVNCGSHKMTSSTNEADARAKMLIYLVENGFITL